MELKNIIDSKSATKVIMAVGIIIVALIIFQAGIFVGYHKAGFSYRLGENYYRTFGGPQNGIMEMPGEGFPNANGISGRIIKINLPSIIIEDRASVERVAIVTDDTSVRSLRKEINPTDLKVGDMVVIIGSSDNNAQIDAKLIRIIPLPPKTQNQTASTSVTIK